MIESLAMWVFFGTGAQETRGAGIDTFGKTAKPGQRPVKGGTPMMRSARSAAAGRNLSTPMHGATITEALFGLESITVLVGLVPALAQSGGSVYGQPSRHNLRVLHQALTCYAADWSDRQFTAVPDDLGVVGGSCAAYANEFGCYPPLLAGFACDGSLWGFWTACTGIFSSCLPNWAGTLPMRLDPDAPFGVFRLPQVKPIHDYVGGRFYDPTFFSILDHEAFMAARPAFDQDCEFVPDVGTIRSTYAFSPAAMYHPDVLRARSAGGYQDPDTLDHGYQSPAVTQAAHPSQKTWMIEHNWLVDPPAPCNPGYADPFGGFPSGCNPYLFNHGADAEPLTLFFDGSIEALRTGDVAEDDARVLEQTRGVDGLWSRDTPFGETGYFGDASFDGTVVSHHILTTDGILGRDRLARPPARRAGGASR